jgi:hypothetical protein
MSNLYRPFVSVSCLRYVVTGTGRCGTVWIAKLLTANGISCGHESVFDTGGIRSAIKRLNDKKGMMSMVSTHKRTCKTEDGWELLPQWWEEPIIADSSLMAAPYLNKIEAKKIHVIRDPFKVVDSFCYGMEMFKGCEPINEWEKFIYKHATSLRQPDLSQIDRACLFYVEWISLIEMCDEVFVLNLEKGPTPELAKHLGIRDLNVVEGVNSMPREKNLSFTDIHQISNSEIRDRFVIVGEKYGYNMSPRYRIMV